MGYMSKIFIMQRCERNRYENNKIVHTEVYGMEVARFELDKVEKTGFTNLFNTPVDFTINGDDVNNTRADLTADRYGEHCKYAEIDDVIKWLENQVVTDDYRRWKPLLAMLKEFNSDDWNVYRDFGDIDYKERLVVVHYGW